MLQIKIWYPEVDILKATAILLIVFCHIDNYVSCYDLIRLVDGYAALIGLSLFFFISGFLLSQTDSIITTIKDIKKFYIKKFIRIFPLYWIALASLIVIFGLLQINPGNVNPYNFHLDNLLLHFCGLQGFFPNNNIQSMWFVGVIIIFYILYPIIMCLSKNTYDILIVSSIVLIFLTLLHIIFGLFDINVLIYYPIFISGIFINRIVYSFKVIVNEILLKQILLYNAILIFLFFLVIVIGRVTQLNFPIFSQILIICAMISLCVFYLLFIRLFIKIRGKIMLLISSIAFATYAIYLFQHQFLAFFSLIINLIIQNTFIQDLIILTFGIAGAFLCGIIIQNIEKYIFMHYIMSPTRSFLLK
jgi:peptidoglycan/LPS O-acetylase OafA/YrhL